VSSFRVNLPNKTELAALPTAKLTEKIKSNFNIVKSIVAYGEDAVLAGTNAGTLVMY
jgi:hypothetical protein